MNFHKPACTPCFFTTSTMRIFPNTSCANPENLFQMLWTKGIVNKQSLDICLKEFVNFISIVILHSKHKKIITSISRHSEYPTYRNCRGDIALAEPPTPTDKDKNYIFTRQIWRKV